MHQQRWALLINLLIIYLSLIEAKNEHEMSFENHTCTVKDGDRLINVVDCNLGKSTKRRALNMKLKFNKNIEEFSMNLLITMPRKLEQFILLNLTHLNGCDVLANRNQVTLVTVWRGSLDRYGNFPHKCPLHSNVAYYVSGYRFDLDNVPAFNFEAKMLIRYTLKFTKRTEINGFVAAVITLKNGKRH